MKRFTLVFMAVVSAALGQQPSWWSERGVLNANPSFDYSAVNTGQLKWLTLQSRNEVDQYARRGGNLALDSIITGWTLNNTGNFLGANQGQAKDLVTKIFFGLQNSGFSFALPLQGAASDFGLLNAGQAKNLFNWNIYGVPQNGLADPIITEVVSQGSTFPPGAATDWIELYNPTGAAIDLGNYEITDDGGGFTNGAPRTFVQGGYRFPAGTMIAAGGYYVVLANNGAAVPNYLSTGFNLGNEGEYLGLFRWNGATKTLIQNFFPRLPYQTGGLSFGLAPNLSTSGFFRAPTPGAANPVPDIISRRILLPPVITSARGLRSGAFNLMITNPNPGGTIRYRLDADDLPGPGGSLVYNPLAPPVINPIPGGIVVRARVEDIQGGQNVFSDTVTSTFVFEDLVRNQGGATDPRVNGAGGAPLDGRYVSTMNVTDEYTFGAPPSALPIEYNMDAGPLAGLTTPQVVAALRSVPSIFITVDPNDLFDVFVDGGIPDGNDALFENVTNRNFPYPSIPATFEWWDPAAPGRELETPISMEITGDSSANWTVTKKKSFKIRINKDQLDEGVRFPFFGESDPPLVSALALKTPTHDSWHIRPNIWANIYDHALYVSDAMVTESIRECNMTDALTGVSASAATDLLTKTDHDLVTGQAVVITFTSGFSGLTSGGRYYVINVSATTFRLASTPANATAGIAIDVTSDGSNATVADPYIQPRTQMVHVYLNGYYWGVYYCHERPDEAYAARCRGGFTQDYLSYDDAAAAENQVPGGLTPANWDINDYIDYIIVYHLCGVQDWPGNNLRLTGRATAPNGYQYFGWGAEFLTMQTIGIRVSPYSAAGPNLNVVDTMGGGGTQLYTQQIVPNATLKAKFAARLTALCTNNGPLTVANFTARLNNLYNRFESLGPLESARWGDSFSGIFGNPVYASPNAVPTLQAEKARVDTFLTYRCWLMFQSLNNRMALGLTNPYPTPAWPAPF